MPPPKQPEAASSRQQRRCATAFAPCWTGPGARPPLSLSRSPVRHPWRVSWITYLVSGRGRCRCQPVDRRRGPRPARHGSPSVARARTMVAKATRGRSIVGSHETTTCTGQCKQPCSCGARGYTLTQALRSATSTFRDSECSVWCACKGSLSLQLFNRTTRKGALFSFLGAGSMQIKVQSCVVALSLSTCPV